MVISEELRGRIDREIEKFPERRGGILGALHAVQAEFGCVSLDASRELAEIFEVHPVELVELVSFYNMFHQDPADGTRCTCARTSRASCEEPARSCGGSKRTLA